MSILEEIIKEEISKINFSEHVLGNEPIGSDEFEDMESIMLAFRYARLSLPFIIKFTNDIREHYAREVAIASLEKASEEAFLRITRLDKNFRNSTKRTDTIYGLWGSYNETTIVDKESITNQENIVLL